MPADPFAAAISCPSGLVAACAPLLGFVPRRCLVAFVHGVPSRRAPVIVRVDLPTRSETPSVVGALTHAIAGTGGSAVDAVAWVDDSNDTPRHLLASSDVHSQLTKALTNARLDVGAAVSTNGSVWWSHMCHDDACCPPEGTRLDQPAMDGVRAEFAYVGVSPLPSRQDVGNRVRRDRRQAEAVGRVMARGRVPRQTARWRDSQIRFLSRLLVPADHSPATECRPLDDVPITPATAARVYRGLAATSVRDVLLRRLALSGSGCRSCWSHALSTLSALVRRAPAGHVAPVATVLALIAWLQGEGALANLSLERTGSEPGYRLAELARELVASGTDPRAWRDSLSTLTEADCRDPSRRLASDSRQRRGREEG